MHISKLEIENFRSLKKEIIEFHSGINVIIGHNNVGKTNVIKALSLILNSNRTKRLDINDINQNFSEEEIKKEAPKVTISIYFNESEKEEEFSEDLVLASTWLTKLEKPYEAKLTYEFFLPEREQEDYQNKLMEINTTNDDWKEKFWKMLEHNFLRKYIYKIYVGNPEQKVVVDSESINKIDFQFIDAIRDASRDLLSGKNSLLKEVIDFFMDFEIKNDSKMGEKDKNVEIQKRKDEFSEESKKIIKQLQNRIKCGKDEMLRYSDKTGATFNKYKPDFDGHILDTELYSALKLIVKHETGMKIPISNNGLGYNNLIYISLLLAKMQKDASGEYLGSNAKIFPVLAIEEPEAHLHPAMQYKFLKFLKENIRGKARQIFITTHSSNITAAVDLDEIIVMNLTYDELSKEERLNIAYPRKIFTNTKEDKDSKAYIKRFLDVTKSDMLFSKAVIFVEGIAEQLLMPTFIRYFEKRKEEPKTIEDYHISIININGRYFEHFLKLFNMTRTGAINKKIVCITDVDCQRMKNSKGNKFEKCYPFELDLCQAEFEYKDCSNNFITNNRENSSNIKIFHQKFKEGKTFEYSLMFENIDDNLLTNSIKNKLELEKMIKDFKEKKTIVELLEHLSKSDENKRIKEGIKGNLINSVDEEILKKHLISARYLNSIEKGEHALELAEILEDKIDQFDLQIPSYMEEAIEWICK